VLLAGHAASLPAGSLPPVQLLALRPATRADDEAILAVWVARDTADAGAPDYTLDDVHTDLESPDIDVLVVERASEMVAVAALEEKGCVAGVHPAHEAPEVEDVLVEGLEERARDRGIATLRFYMNAANAQGLERLRAGGYAPAFHYVKLRVEADGLPDGAPQADGLRSYAGGDAEDRALHAVIRAAFADIPGDQPSDYDTFRREVVERPSFAPELSWVLERDGAVAGAALCERREGAGYVMDLAVAREHRGHGWGRILLATALAGFRAQALDGGELWVNGANAPALGLYTSLGMREVTRQERWEKTL
jgi:ribosomal protein S18 acetylase RimI-like enzyme